jgi:hypothetical protein
VDI